MAFDRGNTVFYDTVLADTSVRLRGLFSSSCVQHLMFRSGTYKLRLLFRDKNLYYFKGHSNDKFGESCDHHISVVVVET